MIVIGHRGARGLAPENTLAALQKGLEHGATMLEFDVRVTADNIPVLIHDRYQRDLSGRKLDIRQQTFAALQAHNPDLTTLKSVFETLPPTTQLYIEVKPAEQVEPIVTVIDQFAAKEWPTKNIYLASKHQKTLLALHKALPNIQTVVVEPWSGVHASRRARQLNTNLISMNRLWLWSGFIRAVAHSGNQLFAYTVNDPEKAKKWQRYGLAGIVTDYPDRFKK
jgi:glycerophosphoryl diester phosphodiesterase